LQFIKLLALRQSPSNFRTLASAAGTCWENQSGVPMRPIVKSIFGLVGTMASRFSLAAKLYSIFALFAVLVAAITALSDYNTRQNAELTEAVSTASRAALNVGRINSLVYAVVM